MRPGPAKKGTFDIYYRCARKGRADLFLAVGADGMKRGTNGGDWLYTGGRA